MFHRDTWAAAGAAGGTGGGGVGASASAGLWQSRHRRGWCLQQGAPLLPSSIHLLLTQTWVQVPGLFPPGEEVKLSSVEADLLTPPSLTPYPPLGNIPMSPWRWNGSFVAFSFFFFFSDLIIYYWPHTLLSKSFRHVWPLTTSRLSFFFFLKLEKNVFRPTAAISLNNSLFQFFF